MITDLAPASRTDEPRTDPDREWMREAPLRATLVLADGMRFEGWGLGERATAQGELVFTTAMTGYQEALTDPSYRGQLLMFTFPLIGNYGVTDGRAQSAEIHARGAIVSTLSPPASGQASLRDYLLAQRVPTVYGVDTRAIAAHIRTHGVMSAVLILHDAEVIPERVGSLDPTSEESAYDRTDFVGQTTVRTRELYGSGRRRLALLDCGNKRSVIDELVRRDASVLVLPAWTSPQEIRDLDVEGVILSNGPGNPHGSAAVIETVAALYGTMPLFGICLGHQVLALAAGGRTYKLKFGHRGANHPVQDVDTGKAFVTTQNHGYAVDPHSLPADLMVSLRNLNDDTVEGLRHRRWPVRSVQFHPEGAPGPTDAGVVLDEWLAEIA